MQKNIFYAQSGGPTAVLNASACGVIETASHYPDRIGKVYAGKNGIIGALKEELIDTSCESRETITQLKYTPASAFGSCRYKLDTYEKNPAVYERLFEVFAAHNIGYFFYNGGNDSQDTSAKIAAVSQRLAYPLTCIGIPKTIDNDLPITDNCPGFGSVAKYVAISTREAALDVASMAASSTKVFILEVMGRHAGWIAAASGLAAEEANDPPHIILLPEVAFDQAAFLAHVKKTVTEQGYCVIVASEGVRNPDGSFVAESGIKDAFGHAQLGGVAPVIANLIQQNLGYKYHWAVSDYLQRAARHIASQTDLDQAYAMGEAAVLRGLAGANHIMLTIKRHEGPTYRWSIESAPLNQVANVDAKLPHHFITEDGFGITAACRAYLQPLIQGEAYPPYQNGLPCYARLKRVLVAPKVNRAFAF